MTTSEAGISIREFARRDGCSDTLVRDGVMRGALHLSADKKLDPALVGSGWRKTNRQRPGGPSDAARPTAASLRVPDELKALLSDSTLVERLSKGLVPLAEAEEIKTNALALKHLIAARRATGELVDAEVAENVIFMAVREFRDAFLAWPSKVAPLIASDLGVPTERLLHSLDEHVYQQLVDLGEPQPDFSE